MSARASTTAIVREHMPALDGLRGIAVLLVLAHAFDLISRAGPLDDTLNAGWIGVQLFFVLSGFLITGILLDARDAPGYYRTFFTRRMLRIFPLYYMVLIVAYIIIPLDADPPAGHGAHQFWLWTYTNNYAAAFGKEEHAFPHFWSLAVEEQFYLVWPFVVRLAGRRGVAILATVAIGAAIACRILARAHWGEEAAYLFTPCRMDALALGALAACLVRAPATIVDRTALPFGSASRSARLALDRMPPLALRLGGGLVVIAGLLVGKLDRTGAPMQYAGYTIIALGFALILLGALDHHRTALRPRCAPGQVPAREGSRFLKWGALRRVGMYSYGMYVFHMPLHLYVGLPIVGDAPSVPVAIAYLVVMSAATFGIAAASYHLFERRFLALKARLAP